MPPSTTSTPETAGPDFRAARRGAGLAVRTLADESGVSHSTISRWERGERAISASTYAHLTRTLADFMAGKWSA